MLESHESVQQAYQRTQQSEADIFMVRLHPTGWTSVSRDLLKQMTGEGKGELTLTSALPTERLPYLHPDLPLEMALRYVYQSPLVPVVSRADFRKLEGVISRDAVLNKYRVVSRAPE